MNQMHPDNKWDTDSKDVNNSSNAYIRHGTGRQMCPEQVTLTAKHNGEVRL